MHLLRNGAEAHELTREDRAKGGRARAEKLRKRKELRERFQVEQLEDLTEAELELLDRALVRLGLLIASDDDRVAGRASKEVLDRVLGRPKLAFSPGLCTVQDVVRETLPAAKQTVARGNCRVGKTRLLEQPQTRPRGLAEADIRRGAAGRQGQPRRQPRAKIVKRLRYFFSAARARG